MEHICAGVSHFPKFIVGDLGNGIGIFYDSGVSHQNAGNIGPVFVYICIQRSGGQRTGDITATTGESTDTAVGHYTIETGGNHAFAFGLGAEGGVGLFGVHSAVNVKEHPLGSINEFKA